MSSLGPEEKARLNYDPRFYFTGKPCKHGHIALRQSSDSHCTSCVKIKRDKKQATEKHKAYMRNWRASNVELRKSYEAKWRKNHPHSVAAKNLNRRGRVVNAEGFHTAEDIKILRNTQKECVHCSISFSREAPSTIDHIQALSTSGSNWPSNLQLLCKSCNSAKGAR